MAFLKFNKGGREDFHSHVFNALTWFITGDLTEQKVDGTLKKYKRSIIPKFTSKSNCHRVFAQKDSWCFTLRGCWEEKWCEINNSKTEKTILTNNRKIVSKEKL